MAWNTERTKQLLLDAAVQEFAEYGLQGARVDRIAANAGVNKERLYQYFGNKRRLFDTVLTQELSNLAAAVPLTVEQAADLGDYAGRVFDYHAAHPRLIRLMQWEGLQSGDGDVVGETERTAYYARKVQALAEAQRTGNLSHQYEPAYLSYAVIALSVWWFSVPQIIRMLTAGQDSDDQATRRAALVAMIRQLASAAPDA